MDGTAPASWARSPDYRQHSARILLALAMVMQTYGQLPEMLANMTTDQLTQMNEIYGKARVADFKKIDVNKAEAEAIALFTELAEKFGSEKLAGNYTMGGIARSSIFEIQHLSPGKPAPDISGEDTEGTKFKLSDYQGKVVVLSFWGTWCGPCVVEMPQEREIVSRLKGKKFALMGVNSDVEKSKPKDEVEREMITWRQCWCGEKGTEGEIPSSWNITGWPTIYVLDHKGVTLRPKQAMRRGLPTRSSTSWSQRLMLASDVRAASACQLSTSILGRHSVRIVR